MVDFPEPETPQTAVNLFRGMYRSSPLWFLNLAPWRANQVGDFVDALHLPGSLRLVPLSGCGMPSRRYFPVRDFFDLRSLFNGPCSRRVPP